MVFKAPVFFVALFLLISPSLKSQDQVVIDSLKISIEYSGPLQMLRAYNQLGWQYRKVFPDSSIYFLNKSLLLFDKVQDKSLLPETYNFMGVAYLYKSDYLNSYDYHEKAKDLALANGDSIQYAHALNSLGRLYEGTAAYDKAIEYYNKALQIFKRLDDQIGLAYIYSSLATFYQSQKNYGRAEQMSKLALNIRLEEELWAGAAFSYLELAKIYNDNNQEELAFATLKQAEFYSDSVTHNMVLKAEINIEIADLYRRKKQYKEALPLMELSETIAEKIENQNLFKKVYNQFGKLQYDLENYNKAIEYHNKVVESSEKSAFISELREAYFQLSMNYERKGDIRQAYDYFKKYNTLQQRFLDTEKARLVQQHESRIALETRAKENELLKVEQTKNAELIDEQNLRNIALAVTIFLLLIFLITFMFYSFKRKRDNMLLILQKNKLADINLQKDTLMNILTHDLKAPFNRILGLCNLARVDKGNEEQYLKMIQEIGVSGKTLIVNVLDANKLETGDPKENITQVNLLEILTSKINNYQEDAKAKGIAIYSDLKINTVFSTNQLFVERIIDNLISNAIKYSKKESAVEIKAQLENESLMLTITDQGPGFTEDDKLNLYKKFKTLSAKPTAGEVSNGLGLSLVKTLVDKLGGKITLTSAVNQGSTFEVILPSLKY